MWRMICFWFVLRRHKLRRANTISFRLRKETVCRLAAKPFPGLFHDGPPKARLRISKPAFFRPRRRQTCLSFNAARIGNALDQVFLAV